jgi:cytochrome d ubiquinol oxidase subunit II
MLETIWFILWGILWAVYFMLDGFDLGLGTLLPFVTRDETERRMLYTSMGPFWNGNEVWLLTAGGATFAAFPAAYATMFSAMYTPLMLLLFALIIRGIAFEYRGKVDHPAWRARWDALFIVGSALPMLLLGVAFANIFAGVPVDADGVLQGNLLTFLNPYGLLGGALFVMLFLVHGAIWGAWRTAGELSARAGRTAVRLWPALFAVAVLFLVASWFATPLYRNCLHMPLLWAFPLLAAIGLILTRICMAQEQWGKAWGCSAMTIVAATFFGVAGLFPNIFPSSIDPAFSRTAFNSASTPRTLGIMLAVALVMVPIVIAYQVWVYRLFRGKITRESPSYE